MAPLTLSRAARDSLIVTLGGQAERVLGTVTAVALRWGLSPASLGVYTGLRLYLDNTNRSSLGVGLGAVQEIPVLLAQGRRAEAQRIANIAHTTNTLTCLIYAAGLLALAAWWAGSHAGNPLAPMWTRGLACMAGLAILKRYESFLIVVLRAHGEFGLTTRLDVFESCISAVAVGFGLWVAGFWGLIASVGVILVAKILYLHAAHPLRFAWCWHAPTVGRLMRVGLPILANTAVFGAMIGIDRVLILGLVPNGEHEAGLYTIALMGTGWSLDLAGRVGIVLSTHFLTTLGLSGEPSAVARQALRSTEALVPILSAGGAIAYVFAPSFLGMLMPRYFQGVEAIRPLLPGMVLLAICWPGRQLLIAIGRPWRLFASTLLGLAFLAECGAVGAFRQGMVGVAWGMSIGYMGVFLTLSATAFVPVLGWQVWLVHCMKCISVLSLFLASAMIAAHRPLAGPAWVVWASRGGILASLGLPLLLYCGWKQGLGALIAHRFTKAGAVTPC